MSDCDLLTIIQLFIEFLWKFSFALTTTNKTINSWKFQSLLVLPTTQMGYLPTDKWVIYFSFCNKYYKARATEK